MPQFNLEEYDLVEDRIRAFYNDHPDGRIVAYEMTDEADRAKGYFIVRAQIFIDHDDQHANCPKASGLAFEIEGTAGANKTAALENAETSAIGRALANAGYASKKRPSRTEMEKAARGPQQRGAAKPVPEEFLIRLDASVSMEEVKALWEEALSAGFSEEAKADFSKKRKVLENA